MSDLGGFVAAGVAGVVVWALGQHYVGRTRGQRRDRVEPTMASTPRGGGLRLDPSKLFSGFMDLIEQDQQAPAPVHQATTRKSSVLPSAVRSSAGAGAGSLRPLLDLIARGESSGDYNKVWGGIRREDRPRRPLTSMTVGEVLAWQASIDHKYMSEASGRYQVMEDTLRPLVGRVVSANDLYDPDTQDKIAIHLMNRRGLADYRSGKISAEKFADKLAREWAAVGVQRRQRGHRRTVNRGQSYYSGDGLNRASIKPDEMLAAISRIA